VSADGAALLREAYGRISRRDVDGSLTLFHEDVVWTEQMLPETKLFHGHEGVRQWIADVTQAVEWGTLEFVSLEQAGDDAVSEALVHTKGIGSGVEVTATIFHVVRFRDGKIAAITALTDRDEARRAAGLV
jgi:ketosteroid isomerase-like protein